MDKLISAVTAWVVGVIAALGYGGIVILMAIESACVPLPSEITMPFAGYLVSTGRFALRGIGRAQDLYTLEPSIATDEVLAGRYERYLKS